MESKTWDEILEWTFADRDELWFERMLQLFPKQKVKVLSDEPQVGPDNWPYLLLTKEGGEESVEQVLNWCASHGVGIVLNPEKEDPDLILPYGMIWSYLTFGTFLFSEKEVREQISAEGDKKQMYAGDPSEDFLPAPVKNILREFFAQQSLEEVKCLMVKFPESDSFELCFSSESLGSPPEKEHEGILEAISWFLPRHYPLALVSESTINHPFAKL